MEQITFGGNRDVDSPDSRIIRPSPTALTSLCPFCSTFYDFVQVLLYTTYADPKPLYIPSVIPYDALAKLATSPK